MKKKKKSNIVNYYGLTKEEYIGLIKQCGMTTKKWTLSKWKEFNIKRLAILNSRNKKGSLKKILRIFRKGKNK